jgi:hypothetical protein
MPAQIGRNHSQMPCYRGSPGSGILAKIKLNKYFKIKKNEKYARQFFFLFNRAYCIIYLWLIFVIQKQFLNYRKRRKIENSWTLECTRFLWKTAY